MSKKLKPKLANQDYLEYYDQLDENEKEWIKQFYEEYHEGRFYTKRDNIIKDEEVKKEAIRNSNQTYRDDLFSVAQREGLLTSLTGDQQDFMEEASDFWEWNNIYKQFGYEQAAECILQQAIDDIRNSEIDEEITLMRFYSKMRELDRLKKREPKKKRAKRGKNE